MHTVLIVLQVIVALGLLNVWIVRFGIPTRYRGGGAANMREEFNAYGLPSWFMWVVGGLKIGVAIALLVGIWVPSLVRPAGFVLILLMAGAFVMHVKIKDPVVRALPALAMFVMAGVITLLSN